MKDDAPGFVILGLLGLAVAAWLVFLAWFFVGTARADDEDLFGENNTTYGRFDKYNPALLELRATGVSCWEYVQESSGANIRAAIVEAKAEAAAEFGFRVEERSGCWKQIASGGMAFVYGNSLHGPGGTGAIGIVDKYLTSGQQVVYDSAAMAAWGRNSQKEVVHHEDTGHVLGNFAEGYIHQGGQLKCAALDTPQRRSFMNCGLLNNQFIDDYIRATWAKSHYPDGFKPVCGPSKSLSCAGTGRNAAGFYVWFCEPVRDYKVTRISILRADGSWTGVHLSSTDLDTNRCRGVLMPEGSYMAKRESAISWRFAKNEVVLP